MNNDFHNRKEVRELKNNKNKKHNIPNEVKKHLTEDSLEVVEHFGLEAPKLLNEYSCALEDALIETIKEREYWREIANEFMSRVQEFEVKTRLEKMYNQSMEESNK